MKKYAVYLFVMLILIFFVGNYIVSASTTEVKEKMKNQKEIARQLANF